MKSFSIKFFSAFCNLKRVSWSENFNYLHVRCVKMHQTLHDDINTYAAWLQQKKELAYCIPREIIFSLFVSSRNPFRFGFARSENDWSNVRPTKQFDMAICEKALFKITPFTKAQRWKIVLFANTRIKHHTLFVSHFFHLYWFFDAQSKFVGATQQDPNFEYHMRYDYLIV